MIATPVDPTGDPDARGRPGRPAPGRTRCRGRRCRAGRGTSAGRLMAAESASRSRLTPGARRSRPRPDRSGSTSRCSPLSISRSFAVPSSSRITAKRAPARFACFIWPLKARPATSNWAETRCRRSSSASSKAPLARRRRRRTPRSALSGGASCQRQQDPLDADRPADAGRRRSAEQLDEPVVAAAAADSGLGAEPVAGELEHGPRVVVETADQGRVEAVGDAGRVERAADRVEVLGIGAVESLEHRRRHRPSPPPCPDRRSRRPAAGCVSIRVRTPSESSASCPRR